LITILKNDPSKFIFFKILYRLILDGIAGIIFLTKGKAADCLAIIKAHFAFYGLISKTLRKRKNNFSYPKYNPITNLTLNSNVVFQFYLKKKKTFKELNFEI
jgi:hypothetical protein